MREKKGGSGHRATFATARPRASCSSLAPPPCGEGVCDAASVLRGLELVELRKQDTPHGFAVRSCEAEQPPHHELALSVARKRHKRLGCAQRCLGQQCKNRRIGRVQGLLNDMAGNAMPCKA